MTNLMKLFKYLWYMFIINRNSIVSVQGVKSLGGHIACLCLGFEFYEVKKRFLLLFFKKKNGNTFTLLIIFFEKSLQREYIAQITQYALICRNKPVINSK